MEIHIRSMQLPLDKTSPLCFPSTVGRRELMSDGAMPDFPPGMVCQTRPISQIGFYLWGLSQNCVLTYALRIIGLYVRQEAGGEGGQL